MGETRKIRTAGELRTLPVGSVIRDSHQQVAFYVETGWYIYTGGRRLLIPDLLKSSGPEFEVLFTPEEEG